MAVHLADELQDLAAAQVVVENRIVRQIPDAPLQLDAIRLAIEPVDRDRAAARNQNAHQHADGGRFAGAVRAEEAEHLAPLDGEFEIAHGGEGAVRLSEMPECDHGIFRTLRRHAFDQAHGRTGRHNTGEFKAGCVKQRAIFLFGALLTAEHDQHIDVEKRCLGRNVARGDHALDHNDARVVRHRSPAAAQDICGC